jgi:hypothetical protein
LPILLLVFPGVAGQEGYEFGIVIGHNVIAEFHNFHETGSVAI